VYSGARRCRYRFARSKSPLRGSHILSSLACPDDSNGVVRARRPGCAGKFTLCCRAQHAQRSRIILGLAAGEYATCVIMAHVHDGCALRDSPLPRLNRVKGTFLRAFCTLAQLRLLHVTRCRSHPSSPYSSIVSLFYCLLSRHRGARCALQLLHCVCFALFTAAALLFFSNGKKMKREEGDRKG
jgi:hypothetical protein